MTSFQRADHCVDHVTHTFDFMKDSAHAFGNISQITCQRNVRMEFCQGASSDSQRASKLPRRAPTIALRYVGRNRNRRSPDLIGQGVTLYRRQAFRQCVGLAYKSPTDFPDIQLRVIALSSHVSASLPQAPFSPHLPSVNAAVPSTPLRPHVLTSSRPHVLTSSCHQPLCPSRPYLSSKRTISSSPRYVPDCTSIMCRGILPGFSMRCFVPSGM
jgi:hypothetical protein